MSAGRAALVGWSGLVGGTLLRARPFDLLVNSANGDELRGGRFSEVVFSAARAEKWRANADPDADERHVDELIALLRSFTADRVTLISTVDVYARPEGVDERTPIDPDGLHPYGSNRYRLEQAARDLDSDVLVVRLPALFGPGLKKNAVYDLLHNNRVDLIHPASAFQWYDLTRLPADLDVLRRAGTRLANLVTEPVTTATVVRAAFERPPLPALPGPVVRYDVRTVHDAVFGSESGWIEPAESVLRRLRAFVRTGVPA